MCWREAVLALLLAVGVVSAERAAADTVRYVLRPESRLVTRCHACEPVSSRSAPLTGAFDVGVFPGADYAVEALTGVRWTTDGLAITGSGFVQRFADGSLAMVIDARFGGVPILLTSGRRQRSKAGEIRLQLVSPKGERSSFSITLVAVPEATAAPQVRDTADRCPAVASDGQHDADGDGVGDACDACRHTPADSAVLGNGCTLEQACPCDGPHADEEWPNQRAYVQCVARYLKAQRQEGNLGKSEVGLLLQDAVRSGCGRRVLALAQRE